MPNNSQDRTLARQSVSALDPSDIHTQTKTQPTYTYRPVSSENSITDPVTNFEQTKQIIMDIHIITFSHSTE